MLFTNASWQAICHHACNCSSLPLLSLGMRMGFKNPSRCSLVLSKRRERVAAQKSNFTLFRGCIKRPEVSARMEFDIRWGNRNDTLLRSENVESRPQRYRGFVQVA